MSDYRLKLKIKNNMFLSLIESRGVKTTGEAVRVLGLPAGATLIENLKISAYKENDEIHPTVKAVCEKLDCIPEDIFPHENLHHPLHKNTLEAVVTAGQLQAISKEASGISIEDSVERERLGDLFELVGGILTERESKIINMRYIEGMYFKDIAKHLGLCAERIREIESKSLRKLKNHKENKKILDFFGTY